jgi:hypothetical protein
MDFDKKSYEQAEKQLLELLELFNHILDADTIEAVEHYISHGELEMACELLYLDLINKKAVLHQKKLADKLLETAMLVGLNKESVYKEDFWSIFMQYMHSTGW